MRFWRSLISSGLVFIVILSAGVALADHGAIRVVFVTWEPYGFLDAGRAVGFELDIVAAVMKKMNRKVEFVERPWKRCLYMVEHGLADAILSTLKTPERDKYLHYPDEPISINQTALFVLAGRNIEFSGSYYEIEDYVIGVTSGFSYGAAFDQAVFLKKDENTKTESIVKKILLDRIDIGIGNLAVISSIARKLGVSEKIALLKPLIHSSKLYVGFSKKTMTPKFIQAFSRELTAFKTTSAYQAFLAKYGVPYESQAP